MNSIEITNLNKSMSSFKLTNVNLVLEKGTIMGLIGENGSGKTSLIKCILNFLEPDSGNIKIFNGDLRKNPSFKEDIGVVLDTPYFPTYVNGKRLKEVYKKAYSQWDDDCFKKLISCFKIDLEKVLYKQSRGTMMKLSIALALSHKPKLLILDEPTSGLDPIMRDEFLDLLYDFLQNEEHSVLISSHIVTDLEKVCDTITFIHNGKILLSENKDNLKDSYGIVSFNDNELPSISTNAIVGKKVSELTKKYMVKKNLINALYKYQTPTLEELFVYIINQEEVLADESTTL